MREAYQISIGVMPLAGSAELGASGWKLGDIVMAIRWEKLTVKSQQAVEQAQARAAERGNPEIQPVHFLLALMEDRKGMIPSVLEKNGVPASVRKRTEHNPGEAATSGGPPRSRASARR